MQISACGDDCVSCCRLMEFAKDCRFADCEQRVAAVVSHGLVEY